MKCPNCGAVHPGKVCPNCGYGSSNTPKKKKSKALIIALVLIGIFVALSVLVSLFGDDVNLEAGQASNSGSSSVELDPKSQAMRIDKAVNGMTVAAVKFYDDLLSSMANAESLSETYQLAESAKQSIPKLRTQIEEKSNSTCENYVEASTLYLSNCWAYADYVSKYIEDHKEDDLQKAQETGKVIPMLKIEYESARYEYLKNAGFTDDEINTME